MATTTSNYSLIKPELTEYYDISVQNNNMDTIDTALKTNSDAAIAAQEEINTHEANTQNPHNVTAAQVGAVPATDVGVAGGVAAYDNWIQSIVPAGAIFWFATNFPPINFLECDGSAISRTTYADLFSVIGETFGTGDGLTTFNLPDLRGEFIRGWDNGRGVDSGRAFGSAQSATSFASTGGTWAGAMSIKNYDGTDGSITLQRESAANFANNETYYSIRPRNVALLPCIKY